MTKARFNTSEGVLKEPVFKLLIEKADGSFRVLIDDEKVLKGYRPKKDEQTRLFRCWT